MIVCLCHGVSERTIRQAARAGACSVDDVGQHCGAGTGCGACVDEISRVVNETHAASTALHLPMLTHALAGVGRTR